MSFQVFYAKRLGNCIHCAFIFSFFLCGLFLRGFCYTQLYQLFLSKANNSDTVLWFQVFLNDIDYTVIGNYFCLKTIICLLTVIWFQVTNNNP